MANYRRKFDWEEAKRLRATGLTYEKVAATLGVSEMAVYLALNPEVRVRQEEMRREWVKSGTCTDCGGAATRGYGPNRRGRCRACFAKQRTTSVRDGELQCVTCREWKDDDGFPHNASARCVVRRGRHHQCRACQTEAKREYRRANPERERSYARQYKRAKRALGVAA